MRKLIMQLQLTLDGFYAGPNGEFDWFKLDQESWSERVQHDFPRIGTVLLGRRNYQGFRHYWPKVAERPDVTETDLVFSRWLDEVPKVVFSNTLNEAPWQNSRVSRDLIGEVTSLKAGHGGDLLIMHSSSIGQACMSRGLVDEFWLTVHPVAIGRGLPLFVQPIRLQLLESRVYPTGQVFLHYRTPASEDTGLGPASSP
ncbi:dihydrofolate reductase family protein (plasmid) [Deinococcus sp. KNUC1210]|uniref:dihydrofolate reductase family protein n=1 Tax=Deinococcus sp. KNUC1210 TaxID=2917691 RepID=UPI001EF03EBA|nr:dihydrofolate reductase family protein [Deinococcus sp. KNUC1210]ULH13942.1 dihydrofolate reductase family protein [Deinococcus sp. KNUC1210]